MLTNRLVFIDSEFTDLVHPQGLSIGLEADDGKELYVEVDLKTRVGAELRKRASTFVVDEVLSQFYRRPADITSPGKVGDYMAAWLLRLGHPELHIVYD